MPEYIFLTHEHFDHIWGVNLLKEIYNSQLICSLACSQKIVNKKKNMSIFYNQVGFEIYPADIIVYDETKIQWFNNIFQFIETPGHTDGSICIRIDGKLFTGNTMIKNHKTVIKFPGGNKEKLEKSLAELFSISANQKVIVYPGHGEVFILEDFSPADFC